MSYHLNIYHAGKHKSSIELDELLSRLNERHPGVSLSQWRKTIREISVPNLSIGKLYFCNGHLWSIYQSETQLKKLVEFFAEFNFEVVGEEGEIYEHNNTDGLENGKRLLKNENKLQAGFARLLMRHMLSLLFISTIVFVGIKFL